MRNLGMNGALSVLIGVAGAGKTTLLKPLVDAYHARGCKVWGISLGWTQAKALQETEVDGDCAIDPFFKGIRSGEISLDANSLVIIDELSRVGTKDLLHLLRLQKQHGFQIVAVGDDKQCQAISAGAVIDLLRRALGSEAIPEILTTIRQKKERERDIAGLFRQCTPESVAAALDMKREDGTAELVDGDYQDAVERIAELAVERGATISAPTNADALAIGRAVRKRRGISGGKVIRATDGTGAEFDLELAAGDRVRLFAWTNARFESGKVAHIGNNSSVLDVVRVADDGIWLRTREGNTGFVKWEKLKDQGSGRIKLTYGDCLTIDSAQGMTSDEHIHACPAGTAGIDGPQKLCRQHTSQNRVLPDRLQRRRNAGCAGQPPGRRPRADHRGRHLGEDGEEPVPENAERERDGVPRQRGAGSDQDGEGVSGRIAANGGERAGREAANDGEAAQGLSRAGAVVLSGPAAASGQVQSARGAMRKAGRSVPPFARPGSQ